MNTLRLICYTVSLSIGVSLLASEAQTDEQSPQYPSLLKPILIQKELDEQVVSRKHKAEKDRKIREAQEEALRKRYASTTDKTKKKIQDAALYNTFRAVRRRAAEDGPSLSFMQTEARKNREEILRLIHAVRQGTLSEHAALQKQQNTSQEALEEARRNDSANLEELERRLYPVINDDCGYLPVTHSGEVYYLSMRDTMLYLSNKIRAEQKNLSKEFNKGPLREPIIFYAAWSNDERFAIYPCFRPEVTAKRNQWRSCQTKLQYYEKQNKNSRNLSFQERTALSKNMQEAKRALDKAQAAYKATVEVLPEVEIQVQRQINDIIEANNKEISFSPWLLAKLAEIEKETSKSSILLTIIPPAERIKYGFDALPRYPEAMPQTAPPPPPGRVR